MKADDDDRRLRSVALQNVQTILAARRQAEQELLAAKEALEEETRILELLNRTGAILASNLDVQSLIQTVTDAGRELSGAQFAAFFYAANTSDGDVFTLYTLSGAPREAFEKFGHPRATPIFGPTFRGEGVIRLGDVRKDPRFGKMGPPHHGMPEGHLPVCSYLAVPVISRSGHVLGGLFFGHSQADVFTERSERLIVGIAAQAAIAIDNARLYEDTKRSADDRARRLEMERAARAELERVSVLKDEFLATLSHELRTPLNAIVGWSKILLGRLDAESDMRQGLETIVRNAQAQTQLVADLLDMSRIVSGKIRLDVQRIDLGPVVIAAVDAIRPSAEAKSIAVRTMIDSNAGPVLGDPNRLQQVFWNLLSNAVKFTPKGGKIDVVVARIDSHCEITVQDTGSGISPVFLPHLFERFRQADSSTTRTFGGLGLGLSIVKQLVELHGGTVRAESSGVGKGSTFSVSLPLRVVIERRTADAHPTSGAPIGASVDTSLEGVDVLVVDDEPDARELLHSVLTGAAATVCTAENADRALESIRAHRPHVIVSDIGMPGRDGYQFIQDVRRLTVADGGRTPAIALTAFARTEDRTRAMLAGYQVHMSKPIDPEELVATVKSLAGNSAEQAR